MKNLIQKVEVVDDDDDVVGGAAPLTGGASFRVFTARGGVRGLCASGDNDRQAAVGATEC